MALLIFDDPSTWEASLIERLGDQFSRRFVALRRRHQYIEDSRNTLLAEGREAILRSALSWLSENSLAAYHGTRLNPQELASIRSKGLVTLTARDRVARLERTLSRHVDWSSVAPRLEDVVDRGGLGFMIGSRTGQAHLTLSMSALAHGFNHYLSHGSEFDQRIAHQLLGEEGVELLAQDGSAYILEFCVPGPAAIAASHRYFSAEEMIERGEIPNVINEFLEVLSYRVHDPTFSPTRLQTDCGLVFSATVPPEWLRSVTHWPLGKA